MGRLLLAGCCPEDWSSKGLEIMAHPAAQFPSYHGCVYAYCIKYLTYALRYASNLHMGVQMAPCLKDVS